MPPPCPPPQMTSLLSLSFTLSLPFSFSSVIYEAQFGTDNYVDEQWSAAITVGVDCRSEAEMRWHKVS